MSVHRIKIESDSVPATVVRPTWTGKTDSTREDGAVFFREKLTGDFNFIGTDYALIHGIPDCERIEVFLEEYCDGAWVEAWRGYMTTYDVKFNESSCQASVKPTLADRYECFLREWDNDVEFWPVDRVTVHGIRGIYVAGQHCCTDSIALSDPTPTDPVCSVPSGWCFDKNTRKDFPPPLSVSIITSCFHRIEAVGTLTDPPPYGTGWTHAIGTTWWRCPDDNEDDFGQLKRGRLFSEVLDYIGTNCACPITVRSHFFGVNATHTAPPDNIAYDYAVAHFSTMTIHQKSDVKRPDASDPAQDFIFKMTWKKLLEDLRTIFNVYWTINDDGDMILEHLSYFEASAGLDVTGKNIELEYGKGEESAPNEERFQWADIAGFSDEHAGSPIKYGSCGNGVKTNAVNLFSNDVYYIRSVENQAEISDQGFCLIETVEDDGEYYVVDYNNALGWASLHENLHLHGRPFAEGEMNGAPISFLSVRPSRKLTPFSVNACCYDLPNPSDYITTAVGNAEVDKMTTDYFAGKNVRVLTIEARV